MTKLRIALAAALLAAACGNGDKAKMKDFKEAMCQCHDAPCVDKVNHDFADFTAAMEDKYKGDKHPDEDLMKIGEDATRCEETALNAGSGSASASGSGSGSASASGSGSGSASASASGSGSASASGSAAPH